MPMSTEVWAALLSGAKVLPVERIAREWSLWEHIEARRDAVWRLAEDRAEIKVYAEELSARVAGLRTHELLSERVDNRVWLAMHGELPAGICGWPVVGVL